MKIDEDPRSFYRSAITITAAIVLHVVSSRSFVFSPTLVKSFIFNQKFFLLFLFDGRHEAVFLQFFPPLPLWEAPRRWGSSRRQAGKRDAGFKPGPAGRRACATHEPLNCLRSKNFPTWFKIIHKIMNCTPPTTSVRMYYQSYSTVIPKGLRLLCIFANTVQYSCLYIVRYISFICKLSIMLQTYAHCFATMRLYPRN